MTPEDLSRFASYPLLLPTFLCEPNPKVLGNIVRDSYHVDAFALYQYRYRDQAGYRIRIKEYRGRPLEEGLHLVNYEEWEEREEIRKGRLTTALFRPEPEALNGVEWLHVHEVWLPSLPGAGSAS